MFTNTKESGLESLIVKWLVEQNGYIPVSGMKVTRDASGAVSNA